MTLLAARNVFKIYLKCIEQFNLKRETVWSIQNDQNADVVYWIPN